MTIPDQEPHQEQTSDGMSSEPQNRLGDEERQREYELKGTPLDAEETNATKFRQQVASKQSNLDDYEPEENLWTGGYSPKAMVGTWFAMGIATIGLVIAAFLSELLTAPIALGLIVLMWIAGGLIYAWRRLGFHYQLTTQRFIHQTGIMTRQTDRIEVIDIDDVSYVQGPVQRAFGVGTIHLTGSDRTHPSLSMIGIDKVQEVSGLIDDIRRTERRKRSLHIESI